MTPNEKYMAGRIGLMFQHPFEGTLLLRLESVESKEVGTMGTDGHRILWNKDFVAKLEVDEVKSVIAHEVWHCLLLHFLRRGGRDATLWNIAGDFAINLPLQQHGWKLPKGCLVDEKFEGKTTEDIYDILEKQGKGGGGKGKGKGGKGGPPQPGQPEDFTGNIGEVWDNGGSQATQADQEREWREAVIEAARVAKGRGNCPGYVDGFVKTALQPEVPWHEVLRQLAREFAQDDTSWRVADNRFIASSQFMPGLQSEGLGKLYVVIDTSGSCWGAIPKFIAEVEEIAKECKPSSIVLIECDAKVHKAEEYGPFDDLPRKFHGCGGTDFRPAFDWVRENTWEQPVGMVFLTDLQGTFPPEDPGYPVIWCSNCDLEIPFGQKVLIKE